MSHKYTVELRFAGERLKPSEISSLLDLQPSSFSIAEKNASVKRRRPFWAYNGRGEIGFQAEWMGLEDGFRFLLGVLHRRKVEIVRLSSQFDGIWWCGHFQSSFDGGPMLSSELLLELGGYGIPLAIDNYFSGEDD